jgi:D-galactonate transporter
MVTEQNITLSEDAVYSKVAWRLIPFIFLLYIVAYLDRVNVGFAQLQMKADLGFSDSIYGLGAGMFFFGYFLFEVPSNLLLERFGAKMWIARIMIVWGVVSSAMMFVRTPEWFYTLRFLLGVGEAGFAPGIILYITYWFPAERRARVFSRYMTALAFSGIIGGPLSGWILNSMNGVNGWSGWQWLFLLEGLPAVLLGFAVLFYLDDSPQKAQWLSDEEKILLQRNLAAENAAKSSAHGTRSLLQAIADPKVLLLSFMYFCILCGLYGISFWLPQIIKGLGVQSTVHIGLISALLYGVAVLAMVVVGRNSDATKERRWHIVVCSLMGGAGFILSAVLSSNAAASLIALTVATAGVLAILPVFWAIPTAFLSGTAAAAGIAIVNSFGNLGGFGAPYGIGLLKQATNSTDAAMMILGGVLMLGGTLTLTIKPNDIALEGDHLL